MIYWYNCISHELREHSTSVFFSEDDEEEEAFTIYCGLNVTKDYYNKYEKLFRKNHGGTSVEMSSNMGDAVRKPIIRHGIVKSISFEKIRKEKGERRNDPMVEVGDLIYKVHESTPEEKEWASKMLRKVGFPFDEQVVEASFLSF